MMKLHTFNMHIHIYINIDIHIFFPNHFFPKQGPAVETEECGGSISDSLECIYGGVGNILPPDFADRPGIKADLGSDCRCGCIVHLTVSKPRRIISASAQSCPGRTFWLIQSEPGYRIRFHFDFFRLMCSDQYVRVRDGDSLLSELVGEYMGGTAKTADSILSSGSKLLLEFYSNELSTIGESCKGGFVTHAQQFREYFFFREFFFLKREHPLKSVFPTATIQMSFLIGDSFFFSFLFPSHRAHTHRNIKFEFYCATYQQSDYVKNYHTDHVTNHNGAYHCDPLHRRHNYGERITRCTVYVPLS